MRIMRKLLSVSCVVSALMATEVSAMTQAEMESVVKGMAQHSEGEGGLVEFAFDNLRLYLISDASHNRMRIISPIMRYEEMNQTQIDAVMKANFHRALDARYAVGEGVLYSAYIHPLESLTREQLESAVVQVANLSASFGLEYTSGVLSYRE